MRNTGVYAVRLTKILGGEGSWMDWFGCYDLDCGAQGPQPLRNFYVLAPGEEKWFYIWTISGYGMKQFYLDGFVNYATAGGSQLGGATALCSYTPPYGTTVMPTFGFEYEETVESQTITKREIGTKPLMIKCKTAYGGP